MESKKTTCPFLIIIVLMGSRRRLFFMQRREKKLSLLGSRRLYRYDEVITVQARIRKSATL